MLNNQINKIASNSKIFTRLMRRGTFNNTPFLYSLTTNKLIINSKVNNFCEKKKDNEQTEKKEEYISFGFKTVKKEERQDMVNSVFANVAKR